MRIDLSPNRLHLALGKRYLELNKYPNKLNVNMF